MTKVTDLEANLEQFKIEQAAINSEAAKQLALLQATIKKNNVEADQQFAKIVNALKALQPPTTLPEDTTMIDTEKNGEECGNLDEFMVASDVEEAAITTPSMVVAEELGEKVIYEFGEADLMLGSERLSCDLPAGNKSVEKENIKSGITYEENCYQPYRRVVEQSHNMFGWHAMRLKRRHGGDMLKQHLEDKLIRPLERRLFYLYRSINSIIDPVRIMQLQGALCLLWNSPNLERLHIFDFHTLDIKSSLPFMSFHEAQLVNSDARPVSDYLKSLDCLDQTLNKLKTVETKNIEGLRPELLFISFYLPIPLLLRSLPFKIGELLMVIKGLILLRMLCILFPEPRKKQK
ncbi:hypothetical protein Tco_0656574 [Tanacetum coccineum]|uniref:Uncharacterized protein n=1 Tax=Tanacetum coccineum TaxID=301880 RepID=A0ABQ4X9U4_9ASTR